MTSYADSSALLKRYVDEPDSDLADELLAGDQRTRHRPSHGRRGAPQPRPAAVGHGAQRQPGCVRRDLAAFAIVELDAATCELAATIAEQTGARSLDALHLGAARRLGTALTFITFDVRQGQIARTLGFRVAGR